MKPLLLALILFLAFLFVQGRRLLNDIEQSEISYRDGTYNSKRITNKGWWRVFSVDGKPVEWYIGTDGISVSTPSRMSQ